MRNILLATAIILAGVSTQASAQIFAKAPNKGGGEIVLMEHKGKCEVGRSMFARVSSGESWSGCWVFEDDYVYVKYSSGDFRVYSVDGFTLVPKKRESSSKKRTKKSGT